jgi:dTDP-4-dehydrorhamnose reductase
VCALKILLFGANGQLGQTFLLDGGLAKLGTLTSASRNGQLSDGSVGESADLSEPSSVVALLDRIRPDIVINTAAYTAVDRAEQEEALATVVNGTAVGTIGQWAAKHGSLVVHYSTDYIFEGSLRQPYSTDAVTGPLGAYGRSKLAGELLLRASEAQHLIFRTAWVYAPLGSNFMRTMLRLGAERDELGVVADQFGAPTSTCLIVKATLAALKRWQTSKGSERNALEGTYHLVASGVTTWHGFASAIFDEAVASGLLISAPRILAIGTADYPTQASRPTYSVLDNSEFQRNFGFTLPDWRIGLNDVIAKLSIKTA